MRRELPPTPFPKFLLVLLSSCSAAVLPAATLDLQPTVEACAKNGGGVVRVASGDWEARPIVLRSGVTLEFAHGARLTASTNAADYSVLPRNLRSLIFAANATNVTIRGGELVCGDAEGCRFENCDGVALERVRFHCAGGVRPIVAENCRGLEIRQGLRGAAPYRLVAQEGTVDGASLLPDFTVTPAGIAAAEERFAVLAKGANDSIAWSVFSNRADGACLLVYDARSSKVSAGSFAALEKDAERYSAAVVGCRARGSGDWLDAQRSSPEWDLRDSDLRLWFDPSRVEPYEFRIDAPRKAPLRTRGAAHIFDFSLCPSGEAAKVEWAEYVPRSVAEGRFRRLPGTGVAVGPVVSDTPIRTVVETGKLLFWLRSKYPRRRVVLNAMTGVTNDFSAVVNAELRKFAAIDGVSLGEFPAAQVESAPCAEASRPVSRVDSMSSTRGPWWWFNRLAQKCRTIERSDGVFDLVMIGDSITHFWEGCAYWTAGREAWRSLCQGRSVLNLGYGGDSTQHVLWRLGNGELDGYRAKAVSLMIGTNNACAPNETADAIRSILELIRKKQPEAKVILTALLPRGEPESPERRRVCAVNELIRPMADGKRVVWLDLSDRFLLPDGQVSPGLMTDEWNNATKTQYNLHPYETGYEIWRDAIAEILD